MNGLKEGHSYVWAHLQQLKQKPDPTIEQYHIERIQYIINLYNKIEQINDNDFNIFTEDSLCQQIIDQMNKDVTHSPKPAEAFLQAYNNLFNTTIRMEQL